MKKIIGFILVLLFAFALIGCAKTQEDDEDSIGEFNPNGELVDSKIKIGLICLHDASSTYDKNFINSMYRALNNLGIKEEQLELVTGISEDEACFAKACELAKTCNIVFADSFGHEPFLIEAAKLYPNVNFCHATGNRADVVNLPNFTNAFASIYEGRYLAGIAAGMKLKEMGKTDSPKIGYVGAYTYAEVISGYTSFYLGVKSVVPTVTMDVKFTGSWYDYDAEKEAANALIESGCVLISQHADSYGAPEACEDAGVPNVTYNGSTGSKCPDTYIISSKIDWAPYYEYAIKKTAAGEKIDSNWTGSINTGSVKTTKVGKNAATGTQEAIDEAKAKLLAGSLHVFDTSTFTVDGVHLTSYMADVLYDEDYTADTEAIKDGYFHESEYRSAPYFDILIDGITLLNKAF